MAQYRSCASRPTSRSRCRLRSTSMPSLSSRVLSTSNRKTTECALVIGRLRWCAINSTRREQGSRPVGGIPRRRRIPHRLPHIVRIGDDTVADRIRERAGVGIVLPERRADGGGGDDELVLSVYAGARNVGRPESSPFGRQRRRRGAPAVEGGWPSRLLLEPRRRRI